MMHEVGTRVSLAEPAPAALCRAGAFCCKAPRGSKLAVRFFLGSKQAIGVLAAGRSGHFSGRSSTCLLTTLCPQFWRLTRPSGYWEGADGLPCRLTP